MEMERKITLALGISLLLAGLLYYWNVPTASSQGVTIVSKLVDKTPIDDPEAAVWGQTPVVELPLSAQLITVPRIYEANVKKVSVRSVNDGQRIAFLLEWDASVAASSFMRHEEFRDAAAIQFSVSDKKPYFCMGQEDGRVNIWHWKADWEKDVAKFRDIADAYPNMAHDGYLEETQKDVETFLTGKGAGNIFSDPTLRKSSVENLVAGGFGTLTTTSVQNVQGKGVYKEGKYRAVFSRAMSTNEKELLQFEDGKFYPIAFAVWYGAAGDRDGMKSVSSWYWMTVEARRSPLVYLLPIIALLIVSFGEYFYLKQLKLRKKEVAE